MKASFLFLMLAASLLLSGCTSMLVGKRTPTTIYAPRVLVTPDVNWPSINASLVIAKPRASRVLDSTRIAVRPTANELQVYHGVAWAENAPNILQDAVLRTLEDSDKTMGVGSAEAGINGTYRLLMNIRQFEADYADTNTPSAVLVVTAKLVKNTDQSVLATHTFRAAQPSKSTETVQVVQAFDQALSQMTEQIVGWALTTISERPQAQSYEQPFNDAH